MKLECIYWIVSMLYVQYSIAFNSHYIVIAMFIVVILSSLIIILTAFLRSGYIMVVSYIPNMIRMVLMTSLTIVLYSRPVFGNTIIQRLQESIYTQHVTT